MLKKPAALLLRDNSGRLPSKEQLETLRGRFDVLTVDWLEGEELETFRADFDLAAGVLEDMPTLASLAAFERVLDVLLEHGELAAWVPASGGEN